MSETFNRQNELLPYSVRYQTDSSRPAWKDCPRIIMDAINGKPPRLIETKMSEILQLTYPLLLLLGMMISTYLYSLHNIRTLTHFLLATIFAYIAPFVIMPLLLQMAARKDTGKFDRLFSRYKAHPDIYQDEIYKAAVTRLPRVDFRGRHCAHREDAKIGRFEEQIIHYLDELGIEKATKVENRGYPFLIHQYELTELNWGRREDGTTKNYTLDIAILWPERNIKFNIEIDDPSHNEGRRRQKDKFRDKVLTDRGWFTRRLNHRFLTKGSMEEGELNDTKVRDTLKELVGIIYFFARYANDEAYGILNWWIGRVQNRRLRKEHAKALAT